MHELLLLLYIQFTDIEITDITDPIIM